MPRLLLWSALAAASLAIVPPRASSQAPTGTPPPNGVVLAFSGPDGNAARTAVVHGLDGVITLESVRDALMAASELGVDIGTVDGRSAVAQRTGVEVVVHGRVVEVGRETRTEIVVESSDGRELARVEASGPDTEAGREDISAKAAEAVRSATATLAAEAPPTEPVAEAGGAPPADDAEAEAGAEERSPTHVVTAYGGVGFRHRDATIDAGSAGSRRHEANFMTALLRGDFFPLGDAEELGARGFHVGVDFAVGLGLKTSVAGTDEGTPYYDLAIDAGYLFPFVHGKAGFSAGYGLERYAVPTGGGFPSTSYNMLRFAAGGSYDVIRDLLAVTGELGVRVPLGVGDLADYGENTVAVGMDLVVGVEGGFDSGLAYAFRFGWQRYDLRMYGEAVAPLPQGESGTDDGVWFDLMVGYRFH